MMFNKDLIDKILSGKKTTTIRTKPLYKVGDVTNLMANKDYSRKTGKYIKFKKVYPIKLGNINNSLARKDGFRNLQDLKNYWKKNRKKLGVWNPNLVVYVHEFNVILEEGLP